MAWQRLIDVLEKDPQVGRPAMDMRTRSRTAWSSITEGGPGVRSSAARRPVWLAIQEPSFDRMQAIERNSDRTL